MTFTYNIDTDTRFTKDYAVDFVNLLSEHGFPLSDEQEKDVHKIGTAYGTALNYYIDQAKQLYKQGKLYTATGEDLDNIGKQFGLSRLSGEEDPLYRSRLQALFSPKKVTRPYIEAAVNSFLTLNPVVSLFEPWRYVLHMDNVEPDPYGNLDTGVSYMWSPDYWRSGVLVVKSGLSTELIGMVQQLVALGVKVIFEQFLYSGSDISFDDVAYQDEQSNNYTLVSSTYYLDLIDSDVMDDEEANLDYDDFSVAPGYVEEIAATDTETYGVGNESYQTSNPTTQTGLEFYINENPNEWLKIIYCEDISDSLVFGSFVDAVFEGTVEVSSGSTFTFTDIVNMVYEDALSDTFAITTPPISVVTYEAVSSTFVVQTENTDAVERKEFSGVNPSGLHPSGF